jgi:hypothetical protein
MLFLKSAPQEMPYSLVLTVQLAALYFFSGLLVLQTTLNPDDLYAGLLLGLIVQYVFIYLVLNALRLRARFLQTFSATLGVGLLFNLMSWPVFSILSDVSGSDSLKASMSLIFLMMISWEVLVKAYIFRHAMEMRMFSALALSFSLFFISIAFSQLVFPVEAAG